MGNKRRRIRSTAFAQMRAKQLRQPLTPAEQKLWAALRGRNLGDYKFRRQHPLGKFIVDFFCAKTKLVIEVDGGYHAARRDYDEARTRWLNQRGYRVIRFSNEAVFNNLEGVCRAILEVCEGGGPSPT